MSHQAMTTTMTTAAPHSQTDPGDVITYSPYADSGHPSDEGMYLGMVPYTLPHQDTPGTESGQSQPKRPGGRQRGRRGQQQSQQAQMQQPQPHAGGQAHGHPTHHHQPQQQQQQQQQQGHNAPAGNHPQQQQQHHNQHHAQQPSQPSASQGKQRSDSGNANDGKIPPHGMLTISSPMVRPNIQKSWNNLAKSRSVSVDQKTTFLLDVITAAPHRLRMGCLTDIFDRLDDESPAKMRIAAEFVCENNMSEEVAGWLCKRVVQIENARCQTARTQHAHAQCPNSHQQQQHQPSVEGSCPGSAVGMGAGMSMSGGCPQGGPGAAAGCGSDGSAPSKEGESH